MVQGSATVAVETILGRKIGMTRLFDDEGRSHAVTVIEAGPCTVLQVKNQKRDGYDAVQLGFCDRKRSRATKPELGHVRRGGEAATKAATDAGEQRRVVIEPKRFMREVRLDEEASVAAGDDITVAAFEQVERVDVSGVTKGKGFTGVVKRYGFHGQDATHGAEAVHRVPGSIGMAAYPGRVIKGKKMPGHAGAAKFTVRNLRVMKVDAENNLLVVRGAVPGPNRGFVCVRTAVYQRG